MQAEGAHGQQKTIIRTEVPRAGRSLPARGREAALRESARRAIAQGAAAGDRIPHQRMGVIAGAVITEVNRPVWFLSGTSVG